MKPVPLYPRARVLALFFCLTATTIFAADPAALEKKVDELSQEIALLKQQVEQLKAAQAPTAVAAAATAAPVQPANSGSATAPAVATSEKTETQIGGYGEAVFSAFRHDSSRNVADLRRLVLLVGHRFNDQLTFNSEIEWEHAVASNEDKGESEIEQAFLDYHLPAGPTIRGGLFLIPLGLLNENHEPPVFYGVNRNEVETRIIPTTWREGGFAVRGNTESGLDYEFGITTGFNTTKFDDPGAPLAASHQELQLAHAHDPSFHGALNYRGISGLLLGTGVFTGNSTHANATFKEDSTNPDFAGAKARVTLWDAHARWQPGRWDLSALYAAGSIGDAAQMDATIAAYNEATGNERPWLPSRFNGWYLQAAYKAWESGDRSLSPFVRYEFFDTQAKMPGGFARDPANRDYVFTSGFSFHLHPQVVLKADYQKYQDNPDNDRFNLGLGFMY
jgi:hypothetical protein